MAIVLPTWVTSLWIWIVVPVNHCEYSVVDGIGNRNKKEGKKPTDGNCLKVTDV
jgi:hypothetical protein